jgi:RNA polymerase sigma factor (sigma-70 family)
MSVPPPDVLQVLLSAPDTEARETAWVSFLEEHSGLILHVARSLSRDHDAVMDRYAFVLAALQQDKCARLRAYAADGKGKFTTWLIVVVRRLCFDQHRQRYGRRQADSEGSGERHLQRRLLADLIGGELGLMKVETAPEEAPDEALRRRELRTALEQALAGLEPADRLLLRFRFEDDLSVPEIARIQGEASPFRMYRRLEKVLIAVRLALQAVGIEDAHP